jgi:hypothetical protein
VQYVDVTTQAGINFQHNNGAFGIKLMPETLGSGVACIDYNNDGYQDLFFVNGRDWTAVEVNAYLTARDASIEQYTVISRRANLSGKRTTGAYNVITVTAL